MEAAPGRRAEGPPSPAPPGPSGSRGRGPDSLEEEATTAGASPSPRSAGGAARARFAGTPAARLTPWALAAIAFTGFLPALWNDFVEWDDYVNLFENPHYRGLGLSQLRWMVTSTLMGHYIPVTWLTFGLDYALWGMNPLGYHLTNILLHAANAALFYLVARRLLAAATDWSPRGLGIGAAAAALFFALHPLRAESVAWATERRDVLSGLFFLLTVLLYVRAADGRDAGRRPLLAASVVCFALGLLSKSIIMTLPLCLVILDVYPLARLPWQPWRWTAPAPRRVLLEKVPFVLVGAGGAAVSYWAVAHNDYVTSLAQYPLSARIGMMFYSYWFYLWKTVWPAGLSPLYELPLVVDPLTPRFLGAAVGVAAVTALTVTLAVRARWPAGLAAWAYYGVVLAPVTGLVHAGHQLTHDRYSYLSCLGLALLFGGAASAVIQGRLGAARPAFVRTAAAVAAAWILALGVLTWYQVQIWRDSESLWRFAVEADPECSICHSNLGILLVREHQAYAHGKDHLERTLALRPDRHRTRANYGMALSNLGETDRALEQIHLAVAHFPYDADALSNLAGILISRKRYGEAFRYLHRARAVKPDHPVVLANLGAALIETGQSREAIHHLRRSIELRPREPVTRVLLARAHLALGELAEASRAFESMKQMDVRATRRLATGLVWL